MYLGGHLFLFVLLSAAAIVYSEFAAMVRSNGYIPSGVAGAVVCVLVVALTSIAPHSGGIAVAAVFLALALVRGQWMDPPFSPTFMIGWAFTAAGIVYVGGFLAHGLLLRSLPDGRTWGLVALLGTWFDDTGAYLVGRMLGKHRLAPRISPKKTWEGTIGGFICSASMVLLVGRFFHVSLAHSLVLALAIPVAVTFGDLAESALKRGTGSKDAGRLLPGHGGLFDRIDGLMLAMLVTYYYVRLFV